MAFAYAPTNLDGYKSALTIDSATVDATGETHLFYFTSNTTAKTRSGDNGQWYPDIISWNRKNSREGQLIIGHPPGDYVEVDMTFKSLLQGASILLIMKTEKKGLEPGLLLSELTKNPLIITILQMILATYLKAKNYGL